MGLWKLVLFIHLFLFILFLRLWRVSVDSKVSESFLRYAIFALSLV